MQELLELIWTNISEYISIPYLIVFMMFSYMIKKYFQDLLDKITTFKRKGKIIKIKWKPVYTVLIIATIIAVPFILWFDSGLERIIVTYAIGTSLHETIFSWLEDRILKKK